MRLLTRSSFDGLICATLLKELNLFNEKKFVHPKDIQDGLVALSPDDILVNIPCVPGCGMWFDHHAGGEFRGQMHRHKYNYKYKGAFWPAPSCARVIYEYYGGAKGRLARFRNMLIETDKCNSAHFTMDEVLNPKGMVLLSLITDPRTGFERRHEFRVSHYQLMSSLMDWLRSKNIDDILELEDLRERVRLYESHREPFIEMMKRYSWTQDAAVVTDLRGVDEAYVGSRHIVYALYPDQNVSIRISDEQKGQCCVFSVGCSILNRTAAVDVGRLMLKYGGDGHRRAGTCQVPREDADQVLNELLEEINRQDWQVLNIAGLDG